MMRTSLALAVVVVLGLGSVAMADIGPASLYVDAAPNAYGSPSYAPWLANTEAAIVAGNFVNFGNGAHPGTLNTDPYDSLVYSVGDLGKRETFIYALPNWNAADMTARNFQEKLSINWGGYNYDLNWTTDNWDDADPNNNWVTPGNYAPYGNYGVIGSFGLGYWVYSQTDYSYTSVTQSDIDYFRNDILLGNELTVTGQIRYLTNPDDANSWTYATLQTDVVPAPAALLLGAMGLGLVGWWRKRSA
jgi:hypothetical protein